MKLNNQCSKTAKTFGFVKQVFEHPENQRFSVSSIIKKKNNRGQGHVEMMLSFALFLGAIVFIFIFLNPFASTTQKVYSIDKIKESVIKELNSNIGTLSIIISSKEGASCDISKLNLDLSLNGNKYIIVQDNLLNDKKYTTYYGDIFDGKDSFSLPSAYSTGYLCNTGVYYEDVMATEDNIIKLKDRYENDYNGLKSQLGINEDFLFKVREMSNADFIETLSVSKNTPAGVNVDSKDYAIRMINKDGQISELVLNIRAW